MLIIFTGTIGANFTAKQLHFAERQNFTST